jgi:hypothetical protein
MIALGKSYCGLNNWVELIQSTKPVVYKIDLPRHLVEGNQNDGYFMAHETWDWCIENMNASWYSGIGYKPTFETVSETDATMFKLFWF